LARIGLALREVAGTPNLRGRIIAAIDLRRRLAPSARCAASSPDFC